MKKKVAKSFSFGVPQGSNIGYLLVLDLCGIKSKRSVLREMAKNIGLDADDLNDLDPNSAFLHAIEQLKSSGLIAKVDANYRWVTYQTCSINKREAADELGLPCVDIEPSAILRFHTPGRSPMGGTIEGDKPEVVEKVKQLMADLSEIATTNHVHTMLKNRIAKEADFIRARQNGGAWFLPEKFLPLAEQLRGFVEGIDTGNSTIMIVPVAKGDQRNVESVWKSLGNEVSVVLGNLRRMGDKTIEVMSEAASDTTGKKPDGQGRLNTVYESYRETENRVLAYAEYLGMQAEEMLARINEHRLEFSKKVLSGGDEDDEPAADNGTQEGSQASSQEALA